MKGLFLRAVFAFALLLWALDMVSPWQLLHEQGDENRYAAIKNKGVLVAGTTYNPFNYYIGNNGPQGLEYEMLKAFADYLGVKLEIKTMEHNELFNALQENKIDVAAAGLRFQPSQIDTFQIGPSYMSATWQLAYVHGTNRPNSLADITQPILIPDNQALINYLQEQKKTYPNLTWRTAPLLTQEEQLLLLSNKKVDYTIASSIDIASIRQIKPKIDIAFDVGEKTTLHWYFSPSNADELQAADLDFMHRAQKSGLVARLEEKYFSFLTRFNYVDIQSYIKAIKNVLPKYQDFFQKHSGELDWKLLAAMAYQESHWNPKAVSPTGVRGIMMLTQDTANRMKVTDRFNAEQSIKAGSEYLQWLLEQIPTSVHKDDRIWYALAAYNMGLGHVLDVRRLTKKLGGDPNNWLDVKKNLPLLAEKRYYRDLKYGYARGYEAYSYVENIRRYLNGLRNFNRLQQRTDTELSSLLNPNINEIALYRQIRGQEMSPQLYRKILFNSDRAQKPLDLVKNHAESEKD